MEDWFYRPIKSSNGPSPCVVEIHGGGSTEGYEFMHEFQCLCAYGFAVLTCNFRGTRGYDQGFALQVTGHYMERDPEDIINMARFAIEKGWVDKKRVGVIGGSYGGWLTHWLIGHESDMFAAAVADRSVVNLYDFYGTSDDYRTFEQTILGCFPWEKPSLYAEKSAISYTTSMKTPLMIIYTRKTTTGAP